MIPFTAAIPRSAGRLGLVALVVSSGACRTAAGPAGIPLLEAGSALENEVRPGQTERYQLRLSREDYVVLEVQGQGPPLEVTVADRHGRAAPDLTQGPERVFFLAGGAPPYVLTLRAAAGTREPARYKAVALGSRAPRSEHGRRLAAERAFVEGRFAAREGDEQAMRRAVERYGSALELWRGLRVWPRQAATLEELALAHEALAERPQAHRYLEQAALLWQAVGDRGAEAHNLHLQGTLHAREGHHRESKDAYLRGLALSRRLPQLLNGLATARLELGETEEALAGYGEALESSRSSGEEAEEARALAGLGRVYALVGENQRSLESSAKAIALWRARGDKAAEAASLNNLGFVHLTLGNYSEALTYYAQAMASAGAQPDPLPEVYALLNVGAIHQVLGAPDEALASFDQALERSRRIGHAGLEAAALAGMGRTRTLAGDPQGALDPLLRALDLRRDAGSPRERAVILTDIGRAYALLRRPSDALDAFARALGDARTARDGHQETAILIGLASVERQQGDLPAARGHIERALEWIESQRTKIDSRALRSSQLTSRLDDYALYVRILMELERERPGQGHAASALEVVEKARARGLLEMLSEEREEIRRDLPADLVEAERDLRQRLSGQVAFLLRFPHPPATPDQEARAADAIRDLTRQYQKLEEEIRSRSPRYAALTQPASLSVAQIQREVLDEDTALISYALGRDESYVWLVTRTSVFSATLPPRASIEAGARRVYEALRARNLRDPGEGPAERRARLARADDEYASGARFLSDVLLGPLRGRLDAKRLLVIPDGALHYIPFAVLPDPESGEGAFGSAPPLILRCEVVSAPSASTLHVVRRESLARRPPRKTVAVLADPVFSADDPRVSAPAATPAEARRGEGPFARLPYSRAEAEAVLRLAPRTASMRALDFDASRATALDPALGDYRIIHFATHGILNSQSPELSGLVLSLLDRAGAPQDGFLGLQDVYSLALSAELVVLSACQTALGKEMRGEGLVGLTRGFMYAGAARVIASLWSIDDEATAELMSRLYQGMLGGGLPPAAALREAQISLRQQTRWKSPYYWGSFVLLGEWR